MSKTQRIVVVLFALILAAVFFWAKHKADTLKKISPSELHFASPAPSHQVPTVTDTCIDSDFPCKG